MIEQTEIMNIKEGTYEDHYTTEPIDALITAYMTHQGDTLKIENEKARNLLVSKIIKGDKTFALGDYAYLVKKEGETVQGIWENSKRIQKASA